MNCSCGKAAVLRTRPLGPNDKVEPDGWLYLCDECSAHYAREWDIYGPEWWYPLSVQL